MAVAQTEDVKHEKRKSGTRRHTLITLFQRIHAEKRKKGKAEELMHNSTKTWRHQVHAAQLKEKNKQYSATRAAVEIHCQHGQLNLWNHTY